MSHLIDFLEPIPDHNGTPVFRHADILAYSSEVIELEKRPDAPGGLLAVRCTDEVNVSFVVFAWASAEGAANNFERIFHGSGPSGSLRELRHTFWGERAGGYIHYPPASIISAAFNHLATWFDCD